MNCHSIPIRERRFYYLVVFVSVFLFCATATAFTVRTTKSGELVKWESDEIDVYLSPTLETIGPANEVYFAIIDAFETWIYEADINLTVNFIYGACVSGYSKTDGNTNCIYAKDQPNEGNEDAGGNSSITYSQSSGEILDGDIVFYTGAGEWKFDYEDDGLDFKHVALHEIGHFLGLTHSQINKAIMYPTVSLHTKTVSTLHQDDIYGALALYDTRSLEDHTDCQFAPVSSVPHSTGLLALLLSLLF